ncbi:MAG: hypothetical protein AAB209_10440, partial [Bacteroidota bacterium]
MQKESLQKGSSKSTDLQNDYQQMLRRQEHLTWKNPKLECRSQGILRRSPSAEGIPSEGPSGKCETISSVQTKIRRGYRPFMT